MAFFWASRSSQWSTRWSGPLAHDFLPGFCTFPAFPAQPVVHSMEWTTGSRLPARFRPFPGLAIRASGPLKRVDHWLMTFPPGFGLFQALPTQPVVHSKEWTTGSRLSPRFLPFPSFPAQLVVHSTKWTTSSRPLPQFPPFSGLAIRASGPLDGVDH